MDDADASDAVAAAKAAFPSFSSLPARSRARMLRAYSDILLANRADLAAIIVAENGKPCELLASLLSLFLSTHIILAFLLNRPFD
jgi:acyl-CoA reductase-like NAD-dependent aldehyde dehydrogenase